MSPFLLTVLPPLNHDKKYRVSRKTHSLTDHSHKNRLGPFRLASRPRMHAKIALIPALAEVNASKHLKGGDLVSSAPAVLRQRAMGPRWRQPSGRVKVVKGRMSARTLRPLIPRRIAHLLSTDPSSSWPGPFWYFLLSSLARFRCSTRSETRHCRASCWRQL